VKEAAGEKPVATGERRWRARPMPAFASPMHTATDALKHGVRPL
jgi:hypothetical protein